MFYFELIAYFISSVQMISLIKILCFLFIYGVSSGKESGEVTRASTPFAQGRGFVFYKQNSTPSLFGLVTFLHGTVIVCPLVRLGLTMVKFSYLLVQHS